MNKLWLTLLIVLIAGCSSIQKHEPPVILVDIPKGITDVELIVKTKDCTGNWNFCKWQ